MEGIANHEDINALLGAQARTPATHQRAPQTE